MHDRKEVMRGVQRPFGVFPIQFSSSVCFGFLLHFHVCLLCYFFFHVVGSFAYELLVL